MDLNACLSHIIMSDFSLLLQPDARHRLPDYCRIHLMKINLYRIWMCRFSNLLHCSWYPYNIPVCVNDVPSSLRSQWEIVFNFSSCIGRERPLKWGHYPALRLIFWRDWRSPPEQISTPAIFTSICIFSNQKMEFNNGQTLSTKQPRPFENFFSKLCYLFYLGIMFDRCLWRFFLVTHAAVWTEQISENLCGLSANANRSCTAAG